MEYPDRLKKLKMPTLKYRCLGGDKNERFNIISGTYDKEVTDGIFDLDPNTRTMGHNQKIKKKLCKSNIRKYTFTNRVVSLPQSVIDAKDVRQFEAMLDKYWEQQDQKFNLKADIVIREYTGNHTGKSRYLDHEEVDIVAESQHPEMA